jgi:hypothetical protein
MGDAREACYIISAAMALQKIGHFGPSAFASDRETESARNDYVLQRQAQS